MSTVVGTLLAGALSEIRVSRAGDVIAPDDQDLALFLFNELLDTLNATQRAIYTRGFATFTLTPSLQPHTIGLAANAPTFSVPVGAPQRIVSANLVVSSSFRQKIDIRDQQWWMNLTNRAITSALPTDLFYSPDWPNGSIYLWSVPTTAYGIELETATLFASVAATDTFDLPFGYQAALRLTLAEKAAPHFGQKVSESTRQQAIEARGLVWGNNDEIPDLDLRDGGMPHADPGSFDWRTGFTRQ